MNESIVPIIYMGGTGGNFLSAFLCHARDNNHEMFNLSVHGNAHGVIKDPGSVHGYETPTQIIINDLLSQQKQNDDRIRFMRAHLTDTKLALKYFSKIIKITYDYSESEMIATIVAFKWGIDSKNSVTNNISTEIDRATKIRQGANHYFLAINNPRILNISFNSMLCMDPGIFITNLSTFTNIPKSQFNIKNLKAWRRATKKILVPPE